MGARNVCLGVGVHGGGGGGGGWKEGTVGCVLGSVLTGSVAGGSTRAVEIC